MPTDPTMTSVRRQQQHQRPRTSPSFRRGHTPITRPGTRGGDEVGSDGDEDQGIELLEYEWPDLPPLPTIKDAVTRNRVSYGISYILPVDRGRNAINNQFRTDLRAMFLEPYASDDLHFDENKVKASCKVHFRRNTSDTKWTRQHVNAVPTSLNADSEKMRQLYARSAPSGGGAGRRVGLGINPDKLRTRSSLYLPLKASVSPEMVKIRQEVEQIVKSVTEGDDDDDFDEKKVVVQESKDKAIQKKADESKNRALLQGKVVEFRQRGGQGGEETQKRRQSQSVDTAGCEEKTARGRENSIAGTSRPLAKETLEFRVRPSSSNSERYETYDDLRKCKWTKREIPPDLKSQYLSDQQNQSIWDWLHHDQSMTDFDYFLSVCG